MPTSKPSTFSKKPSLWGWLDDHLLFGLSLFLLAFIPLYPKWPLFDVLPGYIVRVRLEDFLILGGVLVWGVYVLRGRIRLKEIPLFKPMAAYLIVGFLSVLSGIFITQTIYPEFIQIAKASFHYLRRIEYFSLFFIFFSSLKTKKQILWFAGLLPLVILAVSVYGYGQKYLYWPAYSTMNREFSKGIVLYLTEHARVLSTFGGHYDLAAYIMLTLPLLIGMSFLVKRWWLRVPLWLVSLAEFWLLILTASRTSFIAYLVAITVMFGLLAMRRSLVWSATRWLVVTGLSLLIMMSFGDLSERFAQTLHLQDLKSKVMSPFTAPPAEGIALDESLPLEEQLRRVAAKSDAPPTPVKPTDRPADVYVDPYISTEAAELAKEKGATLPAIHVDYSETALKYGLSTGIRLDALWPRAWQGFLRNPLLGSGYSTLVKTQVWEFTQAESTDNDYLRLLGETGLLGFITFLSIFAVTIVLLFKALTKTKDLLLAGLFAGGIGITVGLMVNALYIDVFEASKVAYTYWSLVGLLLAAASLVLSVKKSKARRS
jgi:hypothetical protein